MRAGISWRAATIGTTRSDASVLTRYPNSPGRQVDVGLSSRSGYTVRLIGIDTPETRRPGTPVECGGKEASASLEGLAEGRRARLRTDFSGEARGGYLIRNPISAVS
jgi:endonuclease YncB( thermonuclease family)